MNLRPTCLGARCRNYCNDLTNIMACVTSFDDCYLVFAILKWKGNEKEKEAKKPLSGRRTNSSQWTENVGSRWVDGASQNREGLAGLAQSDSLGRIYENVVQRRSRDANSCSVQEEEEEKEQLASITISEDHINDNNSVNSSCSICDEHFQLGEEAYRIQFSSRVYHRPCLSQTKHLSTLPIRNTH